MQEPSSWTAPDGALAGLIAESRERAEKLRHRDPALATRAASRSAPASLAAALRGACIALVAEIKRSSPSRGQLAPALDAGERARAYANGGAAALSVLTEPTHFGGALDDLDAAAAASLPLLRKDFIVDPRQMLESYAHGASAVLLIARALPPRNLASLAAAARDVGLETLIEVRSEAELHAAIAAGATMIGVNSRDLETLAIEPGVSERLLPMIPKEFPALYESGVLGRADVERAAALGADAVLVGSVLSLAADPTAAARALAGVPRRGRHAA